MDSNVYFLLLKFLIKKKLEKDEEYRYVHLIILTIINENVRHRDVAYNVVAWILYTKNNPYAALILLEKSWQVMISWDLSHLLYTCEIKQKQNLFNSAKLHALVILFNFWYVKKPAKFQVCFQFFEVCPEDFRKCTGCQTATYCSKQCENIHYKYHSAVCEIVKKYKQDT